MPNRSREALRMACARPGMAGPSASVAKVNGGDTVPPSDTAPMASNLAKPVKKSGSTPGPNSSASRRASVADVPNAIFVRALLSATSRKLSGNCRSDCPIRVMPTPYSRDRASTSPRSVGWSRKRGASSMVTG